MIDAINENEIKVQALKVFSKEMQGKLEQNKLDEIYKKFLLGEKGYAYKSRPYIASYVFYTHVELAVSNGFIFIGHGNVVDSPGSGSYWGKLYAKDFDKLRANTDSFWYISDLTSGIFLFFDLNSTLLANFVGFGISSVLSSGTGYGSWSSVH
ncbi:VapA/VapB family virulence-associated protein [Xenorhabdus sp. PR6a]|uniref:VapA/VapB family virulence-associated protein n=1 Tax=Xenorhabdus sp. PR6a TaxID=3025877 RepID=UPI0023581324|nr:VapA/VapB family virulence-associated protein [Xenorhabdus sp. PR6a]MDC9579988.1 VapA/VapB family virulence-associated protein [Xenorhabdus sp. PR6a]